MTAASYGRAPWRVIIIQFLLLAGLLTFFKFYLPYRTRQSAKERQAALEQKITAFFDNAVTEDSEHEISVPLNGEIVKRHPKKLRLTFSPQEAENKLGVPTSSTTDYSGGQHLTWLGTDHKIEAAFNAGKLYCLSFQDLRTAQGEMVYPSFELFHPY